MVMHTKTGRELKEMFDLLLDHFGPQKWWPAETELEMMVGAVLTQNTSWKNVEKAIEHLKNRELLSLKGLRTIHREALAHHIRPAGYYNVKAKRLKNLIDFIFESYGGELPLLLEERTDRLREGLLSINGIGPETADSILLYAARRPIFVVDAYTHRILTRHGMLEETSGYEEMQNLFLDHLPEEEGLFNEFHALIVQAGKAFCKRRPLCASCPLKDWERASTL
jgi:endonuclease III related protein